MENPLIVLEEVANRLAYVLDEYEGMLAEEIKGIIVGEIDYINQTLTDHNQNTLNK